jgi:hypothetical protein
MKLIMAVLFIGVLTSCAGITVTTDFDPKADFVDLKTWSWEPEKADDRPGIDAKTLTAQRVKSAVDGQLGLMGYDKVSMNPDFLVGWHASVKEKMDIQTINNYYGYGPGWGYNYYGGPGPGFSDTYTYYYEEGTLILDIIDPKTHELIWRGTAKAVVDENASPEQRTTKINKAVDMILAKFPPIQQ